MADRTISQEELMFEAWLKEAHEAGVVESYVVQPDSFLLLPKVTVPVTVQMKTKEKVVDRHLCNAHTYTPDFLVILTEMGRRVMEDVWVKALRVSQDIKPVVYVDTKGSFTVQHSQSQMFSCNQKLVYAIFGMWVEKVVPYSKKESCLFRKTWCPEKYRWMKNRKVPTLTVKGEACGTVAEWTRRNLAR